LNNKQSFWYPPMVHQTLLSLDFHRHWNSQSRIEPGPMPAGSYFRELLTVNEVPVYHIVRYHWLEVTRKLTVKLKTSSFSLKISRLWEHRNATKGQCCQIIWANFLAKFTKKCGCWREKNWPQTILAGASDQLFHLHILICYTTPISNSTECMCYCT
jgi:hypothetical protein